MADEARPGDRGRIPHFLLPAGGWGAAAEAKEAIGPRAGAVPRSRAGVGRSRASRRRSSSTSSSTWVTASSGCGRSRPGGCRSPTLRSGGTFRCGAASARSTRQAVTREEIEATLSDPDGAYQRLRRIMDAWARLWFWPLTEGWCDPADASSNGARHCR